MSERRRFPAPWTIREVSEGALAVEDANGVRVCFLYYADGARRSSIPGALSEEEAVRLARWIARLPDLASLNKEKQNSPVQE